jgi:hypothetical protein
MNTKSARYRAKFSIVLGWGLIAACVGVCFAGEGGAGPERFVAAVGGSQFPVTVVRVPLSRYRLGVALAGPRVGDNAPLLEIAQTAGAECAINGTFFAAYPGETHEPYGTLVIDGRLLHLGGLGSRLDVLDDGTVRIVPDHLTIQGSLDGRDAYPSNWYAYNLNQTPTRGGSSAYLFTPERGPTLGFRAGLAIVARRATVTDIVADADVAIPADGFVLALQGREVDVLGWKFHPGQRIAYRAVENGRALRARFSLGAGPTLVRDGEVDAHPAAEGFRDRKIVSSSGTRSVVATTASHEVMLAVIGGATIAQAAWVARALGAEDAMNLDDNGSVGLVCGGRYLVGPGREVPNGLVLWPRA